MFKRWISRSIGLMALLLLLGLPRPARADILVQMLPNGHVRVTPNPVGEILFPLFSMGGVASYRYCWGPPAAAQVLCVAHQTPSSITSEVLSGFTVGTAYQLRVYCWCRVHIQNVNYWDWRPIGLAQFTYNVPPDAVVNTYRVRIRNVLTGQCLYVAAGSFDSKHWGCWADPAMIFYRDIYGDGTSTFRHNATGRCLWGGLPNSPPTGSRPCGGIGTHFNVMVAGNGQVRLFVPTTGISSLIQGYGGCFFTNGGNGGDTLKEFCVGNERSIFALDPV